MKQLKKIGKELRRHTFPTSEDILKERAKRVHMRNMKIEAAVRARKALEEEAKQVRKLRTEYTRAENARKIIRGATKPERVGGGPIKTMFGFEDPFSGTYPKKRK